VQTSLKGNIRKAVPKDPFFKQVGKSVKAAGDNYFQVFFFDSDKVLCYRGRGQKIESHECVCLQCAGRLFYEQRMVMYLPDILAWAARLQLWRQILLA